MKAQSPEDNSIVDFKKQLDEIIKKNNSKLTADKINTTLKALKNNPNISSKRWIWELMQNATDVRYENEKISVKIILEEEKLVFMHNGKYFSINNILALLQQVSSKNSLNLEGQTGKFGTGFIGTHLLSDKIDVKGVLHISNEDFREFQTTLDRSEKTSELLSKLIEKSIEEFYHIEEREDIFKKRPDYLKNRKETDYDTSFTYYLSDEEKKQSANEGISDLINTMPTTLVTQYNKIKQVTIINKKDNLETTYIPTIEGNEVENGITEFTVKVTVKNKEKEESTQELNFLSYLKKDTKNNKEILRLITEILKQDGIIVLLRRDDQKPVLYRNFPLIGTNEFNMPYIVDGFDFNPLEGRDGIFLNGGQNENNLDTQGNLNILNEAYKSSIEFTKLILKKYKNVTNRFLLASTKFPKSVVTLDSYAYKWFFEKLVYYREQLRDILLLKYGNYHKLEKLLLPVFNEHDNIDFYNVVSSLNIRKKILPEIEDYKNWFNIIIKENNEIKGLKIRENNLIKAWGKAEDNKIKYIYDENDLLSDLQKCKNIDNLSKILELDKSQTMEYLNDFILFLKKNCKYEELLNKYSIIPNRNGDFKRIEELCSDDKNKIPNDIMNIYDSISDKKLNEELIDEDINVGYLGDIIHKKDFDDISSYLNKFILENNNIQNKKNLVVYPLLSIKSDKKEILQIYEYLSLFYPLIQKEKIEISDKIRIPIDLWTHALNFWFNEHPKEIETYANIKGFREKILNKNLNDLEIIEWINNYLNFLKLNSPNRNFENLKIFPNQNGNFCALNTLRYDSGFPDEFKDILKKYFNKDKREILFAKEIIAYNSYQIMPEIEITNEIESEFNKLKNINKNNNQLKDIALEILCLYPNNNEQDKIRQYIEYIIYPKKRTSQQLSKNPLECSGFSEIIFNSPEKFVYKEINTKNLNYLPFINYVFEILCDEISKAKNFENIKNKFF